MFNPRAYLLAKTTKVQNSPTAGTVRFVDRIEPGHVINQTSNYQTPGHNPAAEQAHRKPIR